jgi:hypothetical protein
MQYAVDLQLKNDGFVCVSAIQFTLGSIAEAEVNQRPNFN